MSVTSAAPWGISLNGIPLMIARDVNPTTGDPLPAEIDGKFSPAQDNNTPSDQQALWSDFSLGIGIGRTQSGRSGYSYTKGWYTRRPGMAMPAPEMIEVALPGGLSSGHRIVELADFGNDLYLLTDGTQVLRVAAGDPAAVTIDGTSTTPSFAGVNEGLMAWRGSLYASGTTGIMKRTGPGAWTSYAVPVAQMGRITWFYQNVPKTWLVGVFGGSDFRKTDNDPTVWTSPSSPGNWGFATTVGDSSYPIRSLALSNRTVLFPKANGVHSCDQNAYTPNLTPYWEETVDTVNGSCSIVFDGQVYAVYAGGLDRVDVADLQRLDQPENVTPGQGAEGTGPIYGDVSALATDGGWLAAAVDNGSDSYLCHGKDPRRLRLNVDLPMIWHGAEAWWENQIVTAMKRSTKGGRPHFWVATYDRIGGYARLWRIDRPRAADPFLAWLNQEPIRFQTAFTMVLLSETYGNPSARKVPRRGDVTALRLSADRRFDVYAQMDFETPVQQDEAGHDLYTLIPPADDTYTLTVGSLGTTTALNGFDDVAAATADDITAALQALGGSLATIGSASGVSPFIITVPHGETLSTSRGTVDWWYQGTASSSPRQTFLPSESITSGFSVGYRIEGRGQADSPHFLQALGMRSSVLLDQIETKVYPIVFGRYRQNNDGTVDPRDPDAVKAQIEALMASGPVPLYDESNRLCWVKVEPGMSYKKRRGKYGWYATAIITVSIVKRPFYWDSGAFFDDIYTWS